MSTVPNRVLSTAYKMGTCINTYNKKPALFKCSRLHLAHLQINNSLQKQRQNSLNLHVGPA